MPKASGRVELGAAVSRFHNHDIYLAMMARVEASRGEMIRELSEWSGLSRRAAVQRIADVMYPGRTFDEQLYATHSVARNEHMRRGQ